MKKILISCCAFFLLLHSTAYTQQTIDEEKVNKAVALQKKIMQNPGEAMTISAELQALKLNSAESKEVSNRMMKGANEMIVKGKEQAAKIGGITQQQVEKRMVDDKRIMPVTDQARINAIYKKPLSENEIKKFCRIVHEAVKKNLDPVEITQAEKIYAGFKKLYSSPVALGNAAIGCYLNNLTHQSLYILGRVCSEENIDVNNINNYAAFLTNYGVEEGAIPLLNYLKKKFGKDPFIYSNLAAAWMGLGDFTTADKYADSCIRFFPDRSQQAHYVKCIVEESKGNHQGAVSALQQSIGLVYSGEKEAQLRKWDGKMSSSKYSRKLPADALGLSKFIFPAFPKNYQAHIELSADWANYYIQLDHAIEKLQAKSKAITNVMKQHGKVLAEAKMKQLLTSNGGGYAGNKNQQMGWFNFFTTLSIDNALKEEEKRKELEELKDKIKELAGKMDEDCKSLGEKFETACGEGASCPEEEICNSYKPVYDKYMSEANNMLETFYTSFVSFKRRNVNDEVYAAKYCLDDMEYERYKIDKQLEFLGLLKVIGYKTPAYAILFGGFGKKCLKQASQSSVMKALPDFDDLHCPDPWSMKVPGCELSTNCNKISLKADLLLFGYTHTSDLRTGQWVNSTFEFGVTIGSKSIKGVEIGGQVGGYIEIDGQGIADAGVKGGVGAGNEFVGEVGAEVKISVMSGKSNFTTKTEMVPVAKEISATLGNGL